MGRFCPADMLQAAARFLLTDDEAFCPGKAYGFLEEPRGVEAPVTVTAQELRALAGTLDFSTFLPPRIGKLGPADFLIGALEAVCGAEEITLAPRAQQVDLSPYPKLRDLAARRRFRGPLFVRLSASAGLDDPCLSGGHPVIYADVPGERAAMMKPM